MQIFLAMARPQSTNETQVTSPVTPAQAQHRLQQSMQTLVQTTTQTAAQPPRNFHHLHLQNPSPVIPRCR